MSWMQRPTQNLILGQDQPDAMRGDRRRRAAFQMECSFVVLDFSGSPLCAATTY